MAGAHNLNGAVEVDGTRGSVRFHMERLNELVIAEPGRGARVQMVTGAQHPCAGFWLPVGLQGQHPLGGSDCFADQARYMLEAVAAGVPVAPRATLDDGYRVAEIVDATARSARSGRFEDPAFRA